MPERSDATQEGREIPPIHLTRLIAREEANRVILQHLSLCPFSTDEVSRRLRAIETRFATLIGIMIGSGILGGMSGALFTRLLK